MMFDISTIRIMYDNGVIIMEQVDVDKFDNFLTAFVSDMDFTACTFPQLHQCIIVAVQDDGFKSDFYSSFESVFTRMLLDRVIALKTITNDERAIVKSILELFDNDTSKKY